VTATALNCTS